MADIQPNTGDTNWGETMNTYLDVEHNTDGTHSDLTATSVTSTTITSSTGGIVTTGPVNVGDDSELTISSGVVTALGSFHAIDTEGNAGTDDLDTINGGVKGDLLVIRAQDGARVVVCKDETGNLKLAGDFSLNATGDTLALIFTGTNWLEISRSNNT